jgi:hypothetical protein
MIELLHELNPVTGEYSLIIPVTAESHNSTVISMVDGGLSHDPEEAITVYVPLDETPDAGIMGFCRLLVKLLGPVQLYDVAPSIIAFKLISCPTQTN